MFVNNWPWPRTTGGALILPRKMNLSTSLATAIAATRAITTTFRPTFPVFLWLHMPSMTNLLICLSHHVQFKAKCSATEFAEFCARSMYRSLLLTAYSNSIPLESVFLQFPYNLTRHRSRAVTRVQTRVQKTQATLLFPKLWENRDTPWLR